MNFSLIKNFFHKHEATLSFSTLVFGFLFDFFTLKRADFILDNLFIILYLVLVGVSILLINMYDVGKLRNRFMENLYEFLPFVLQFCFGGLFSAFVIFYSKSAYIFTSGAFVLILLSLLIGNEFFKKKYSKLVFQLGLYFVAIFSFSIYFLPVLTKKIGALTFLYSGLISLLLISFFIFKIYFFANRRYQESVKSLIFTIFSLFVFINLLYFTNIIPPIPLALKTLDVYHLVEKQVEGDYLAVYEDDAWWRGLISGQTINLQKGEPLYVFGSVFSPAELDLNVIHDWQYFDDGDWVSVSKISFPIQGGRDEGYRGFSKKENLLSGKWRVDITTERGQVIGRVKFNLKIGNTPTNLKIKII